MANTTSFEEWKAEQLKDPEYRAAVAKLKPLCDLGDSILRLRMQKGWSLRELARHARVRGRRLTKIEMMVGGNPDLRFLEKVARALGSHVVMLIESGNTINEDGEWEEGDNGRT